MTLSENTTGELRCCDIVVVLVSVRGSAVVCDFDGTVATSMVD